MLLGHKLVSVSHLCDWAQTCLEHLNVPFKLFGRHDMIDEFFIHTNVADPDTDDPAVERHRHKSSIRIVERQIEKSLTRVQEVPCVFK